MAEALIACFEIDLHKAHEAPIWAWPSRQANIFLTKHPIDISVVEPVLRIMPNLHVIYILRDPRDMIVSRHGMDPDRYWAGLGFWNTYTHFARRLQAHPRFISIRYEDLVTEPDRVQAYLMKRLPFLTKRAPFSRYHELSRPSEKSVTALGKVRPISSSSIGNWRGNMPRVAGQLKIHGSITKDLIAYGYERDGTWEQDLEGVEPDLSVSHWPEDGPEKWLTKKNTLTNNIKAFWVLLGHYWLFFTMRRGLGMVYRMLARLSRRMSGFRRKSRGGG